MNSILIDSNFRIVRIAVVENGELTELIVENKKEDNIIGNIYCGRIEKILPAMKSVFIDIGCNKNAYMYCENVKKLKCGQEILVKVEKEASGTKGPLVTDKISFAGRFAVLIANEKSIGISKKITDENERKRIRDIIKEILPENFGIIIRTNGEGKSSEDFDFEINMILKYAVKIMDKGRYAKAPCIIHKEFDVVMKAARELFCSNIDRVITNSYEDYEKLLKLTSKYGDNIELIYYNSNIPMFENFFIESQFEKILNKKVWLKSGGFIVIDETEACVVIDVNTGKYTGKKNTEETFLKTNIEAAYEISKQLKLRNLSGMIIIDFIDMKEEESKERLKYELESYVKNDRIKTVVVGMTELGLMQLTRKKTRPSNMKLLTTNCRCCEGNGRMPSLEYILDKITRQIVYIFTSTVFNKITLIADKRLLNAFAGNDMEYKKQLEERYDGIIILDAVENVEFGYFSIEREKI